MLDPQVLDAPDLAKRQYQFDTLDRMGTAVSIAGFGFMGVATIGNIINNGPVFALLFLVMLWMFSPVRYFWQYYRWTKGADTKANLTMLAFLSRQIIIIEGLIGVAIISMSWSEPGALLFWGIGILLAAVILGVAVTRDIGRVAEEKKLS